MNLVFASGFLLPQRLGKIEYFNGVKQLAESKGHRTLFQVVPPLGASKVRAARLAQAIRQNFASGPLHIIAHSMGGLDSRYLIGGNPDLAGRIVSLTTLSAPHHGSPLADLIAPGGSGLLSAIRSFAFNSASRAIGAFGFIRTGAVEDLTKAAAEAAPNVAETHKGRIIVRSYAASGRASGRATSQLFSPSHKYILDIAANGGPNDGTVPVKSADYGRFQETWACDHLDMVGHDLDDVPLFGPRQFDHIEKFKEIIDKLQAEHPGT